LFKEGSHTTKNTASGADVIKMLQCSNLQRYPLFLGLKYDGKLQQYWVLFYLGPVLYNTAMVNYCHSTVITEVMKLYNTEWRDYHGKAVNYCG